MSFCRFGDDSSLYIFERARDDWFECCGCSIAEEGDRVSFTCESYDELIQHVKEHIVRGDVVQSDLISRLEHFKDEVNK